MIQEVPAKSLSGYLMFVVLLAAQLATVFAIIVFPPLLKIAAAVATLLVAVCWIGLFIVHPNEAKVLQLFGSYAGTETRAGLRWANPFYSKTKVSQRVRNFESGKLKVNDKDGNPIVIAAVVVWKVVDTAEAVFEVDDYENFVTIQSEAAIRNLATQHPYDGDEKSEQICLRSHTHQIAELAKSEMQSRLDKAGIEVVESRISHLAYAPEIAQAMLQRQQASAIVAARNKIVEGAVGMVELALKRMAEDGVIELDEERKAAMVSNLMVVLCGDQNVSPVVNTGSLYT